MRVSVPSLFEIQEKYLLELETAAVVASAAESWFAASEPFEPAAASSTEWQVRSETASEWQERLGSMTVERAQELALAASVA